MNQPVINRVSEYPLRIKGFSLISTVEATDACRIEGR